MRVIPTFQNARSQPSFCFSHHTSRFEKGIEKISFSMEILPSIFSLFEEEEVHMLRSW